MIGGEHKKERFSEHIQRLNNQPRRRGYLPGCELRATDITNSFKAAYGPKTLQGNWSEEWSDATFTHGNSVIPTELQKKWRSTYQMMTEEGAQNAHIQPPNAITQVDLVDIVDGRGQCFPGHQYINDPGYAEAIATTHKTTMRESYRHPRDVHEKVKTYVPPVLGRTANAQPRGVMLSIRHRLLHREPPAHFAGLRQSLQQNATTGEPRVNGRELKKALTDYGIACIDPEIDILIHFFDKDNRGDIEISEFCNMLRGELSRRRLDLVKKAYKLIEGNWTAQKVVRLGDLVRLYDASHHPDVMNKKRSEKAILKEFLSLWTESTNNESVVELADFIDYYTDVSALIDSNQYFEQMIRNVWHISGGESNCRNLSCRRVLVTLKTGRQSVEEVKDDLGIEAGDYDRLMANLEGQGIKGITRIDVS